MADAVEILDKRILTADAGNNLFELQYKSDGTERAETEKVKILNSGEIQIDAGLNVGEFPSTGVITKGFATGIFENLKVPVFNSLAEVPNPETGQVVLIGSVLNVYDGSLWIPVNPM